MYALVLGSLLLGASLVVLLALGAANSDLFARNFPLVLILTGASTLALIGLLVFQGLALWRRIKSGIFGARLTARMFRLLGLMAVVPGLVVYLVSMQFLTQSIESWFVVKVENALESGLSLGRSALDHLERELVLKAENVADRITEQPASYQLTRLNDLREAAGLQEISLFDVNGRLLGFASADKDALVPAAPERGAILQARLQQPWSRTELSNEAGGLSVRVVVPVNAISLAEDMRILQVTQPAPAKLAQEALNVEQARREYQELAASRLGLKRLYWLSLTLALLLALFSAIALAFLLSDRLAAPLRALARGTRAVARGDYSQVQTVASRDEFGMLTHSFNRMTQQLNDARSQAQQSRDQLLQANAYLESVLASVNTGVITLDHRFGTRLVNPAAAAVLGVERGALENHALMAWGEAHSGLRRFGALMREHFAEAGRHLWREQVEFEAADGPRILLVHGAPLGSDVAADYALVFDDVSQLVQAQRDAAWGEVARRLAHEIKNPLTPIQLSAERLQVKLADQLDPTALQVLTRATDTIVNQVSALKTLVNAFADYARMPAPAIQRVDLNELVAEVLDLYEGQLHLRRDFAAALPPVAGDPTLLRQVLVNLVKNAEEALAETTAPRIYLRTHASVAGVVLCVEDNGPGFPESLMKRLFEPYATTKTKGTGLGLAIVKKIVEEHHGSIEARNLDPTGASLCVTLPAMQEMEKQDE